MKEYNDELQKKLEFVREKFVVTTHTGVGRLFTSVNRMKMESDLEIPINLRFGNVISTETGKNANQMNEEEWKNFFGLLSDQLKRGYPDLWNKIFR